MTDYFDRKDPSEWVVLTFDFSDELLSGEVLSGSITMAFETVYGTDPDPAALQNGAAALDVEAKRILVPVRGGIAGCRYRVRALSETSNPVKRLVRAGILPVRDA